MNREATRVENERGWPGIVGLRSAGMRPIVTGPWVICGEYGLGEIQGMVCVGVWP